MVNMDDSDLFDEMPFERVINNIVRNRVKYFLLKSEEIILSRDGYYLLAIQSSEKDLSKMILLICFSKIKQCYQANFFLIILLIFF